MRFHTYVAGIATGACMMALAATAADVQPVWGKQCASCHAKDGSGNTKMGKKAGAKDYRDPKVQAAFTDANGVKAIREGIKEGTTEKMKAYPGLTEDEIKGLIALMRGFGNK
jgi:mono/diheme cytochrome c family protein